MYSRFAETGLSNSKFDALDAVQWQCNAILNTEPIQRGIVIRCLIKSWQAGAGLPDVVLSADSPKPADGAPSLRFG